MNLYELNRGEITPANTNTEVDGCNSILIWAKNELQAGWVGILFDIDKIGVSHGGHGAARLPEYLDTQMVAVVLNMKRRRVQHYCKNLGFEKMGRDYQLSANQVEQIHQAKLLNPVGRPRKAAL